MARDDEEGARPIERLSSEKGSGGGCADTTSALALDDLKRAARLSAKRQRAAAAAAAPRAGGNLARKFMAEVDVAAGETVSVFWPLPGEIDTRPLMKALDDKGCRVVLPVMQGAGRPLIFRAWSPGDALVGAGFGTQEPSSDRPQATPRLLLVPLLAFDKEGYRLGYGGGFYDRTLDSLKASAPVRAFGLAFAGQEVSAVPRGPFDQRLDGIVTERAVLTFRNAS